MSPTPTVRTKAFKTSRSLAAWVNGRPEVNVVSVTPEDGRQVLLYSVTVDRRMDRAARVAEAVERLRPPNGLLPLARLVNAVRNLKAFEGLTPREVSNYVSSILEDAGHRVLSHKESKFAGSSAILIELRTKPTNQ